MQRLTRLPKLLTVVLMLAAVGSCSTPPQRITKAPDSPAPIVLKNKYQRLDQKYFEIHYDPIFHMARYVKYVLTKEQLRQQVAKRRERFKVDPLLVQMKFRAIHPKDYSKSGYDKGHLAPAADFSWSQLASDQTFVMSNMVPQKPGLNRMAWRLLEAQVRKWACGEERLTVISGPVLEGEMDTLPSGLPIPRHFFKIVIDETPPRKALAFIYHQEDKTNVMSERMVPLADLDSRLQENFSTLLKTDERQPAQVSEWKECNP